MWRQFEFSLRLAQQRLHVLLNNQVSHIGIHFFIQKWLAPLNFNTSHRTGSTQSHTTGGYQTHLICQTSGFQSGLKSFIHALSTTRMATCCIAGENRCFIFFIVGHKILAHLQKFILLHTTNSFQFLDLFWRHFYHLICPPSHAIH